MRSLIPTVAFVPVLYITDLSDIYELIREIQENSNDIELCDKSQS